MKANKEVRGFRGLWVSLFSIGLIAGLILIPSWFSSKAIQGNANDKNRSFQTMSEDKNLQYYDIRTDKNQTTVENLNNFRNQAGKNSLLIANERQKFVDGEVQLRVKVPTLITEYNQDISIPEVISPDVKQRIAFLTPPSSEKRAEILRGFIKDNNNLLGLNDRQADELKVTADYTNPDGNLSYAHLEQFINGIPVFRGEVKAGFNKRGQMIRVINNLAPSLDYSSLSLDFGNPADAVANAAKYINHELKAEEKSINQIESNNLKAVFGTGDWATTAEKMYFPIDVSVARPAWRVLIWEPVNAYYVIVDAETGTMLWRKNITNDQSQPATFNVYTNSNAMINVAESPAPGTPGPIDPALGTQYPLINRTDVTLVGNEAPYTFNNNGWITNGGDRTDGNAVQAGLDIDGTNGVDTNGEAINAGRVFSYNFTPSFNGIGDAPTLTDYRNGAVTQLFYVNNRYHDEMYRLGFTEAARNFQNVNFTGQGTGNDRVSAEAQDSSGTNNANFATPADGSRGRMQMYVFTPPTPDRDGDLDADIIIHEHTHGLSNRLHGNGSGLGTTHAGGMGEGWSDFYAHCMLSEPNDPINGVYTTGGYTTQAFRTTAPFSTNGNYYYGIRAFPKAVYAFTGGPNNRPHNPLTFKDVDSAQLNVSDGAYAPAFAPSTTSVHFLGEVWSSNLWEVRAKLIARLGWEAGNRKTLQLVTDGMKLAPISPNFIQERDAILAAARASSLDSQMASADVGDVWSGFAVRGMGFSARYTSATAVVEANDLPNVIQTPTFSINDSAGNGNGFADPGENLILDIPLSNSSGGTINNVALQVVGGGTGNYGSIDDPQTVTRGISYQVPANAACGSLLTLTFNVSSDRGNFTITRNLTVGQAITGLSRNFDSSTSLPTGWVSSITGAGTNWTVSTTSVASAPNSLFNATATTSSSGILESEPVSITSTNARLNFKVNYNTESTWDGLTLEMKVGAGAYSDILASGGTFVTGAYNGTLNTGTFPNAGRQAWSGSSGGFIDVDVALPASANGQTVQFRWVQGSDTSVSVQGSFIDDVIVINSYSCSVAVPKSRADFDGDGKSDLSVFRGSEGNWYVNRSTAGFLALNWGISTDTLVPGDYDGDGKTDTAIFRANADGTQPDFYVLNSNGFTVSGVSWGTTDDVPFVADYDGDGKTDYCIRRPSNNTFYVLHANGTTRDYTFGLAGDKAVTGDFDGDSKADFGVFRTSNATWYIAKSTDNSVITSQWGLSTDIPVFADYDGDNKDDIAVFRPSDGTWYIQKSSGGTSFIPFGTNGDIPVPGDYDGDGKDDVAVYRGGTWYELNSTSGFAAIPFGISTDKPILRQYLPQ